MTEPTFVAELQVGEQTALITVEQVDRRWEVSIQGIDQFARIIELVGGVFKTPETDHIIFEGAVRAAVSQINEKRRRALAVKHAKMNARQWLRVHARKEE